MTLYFRQCLVEIRVIFLLDCSLILPLHKYKHSNVGTFLNQKKSKQESHK